MARTAAAANLASSRIVPTAGLVVPTLKTPASDCVSKRSFVCAPRARPTTNVVSRERPDASRIAAPKTAVARRVPTAILVNSSEGGGGQVCLPVSGACDCGPSSVGRPVACRNTNAFGTCWGTEVCGPGGPSACDAPAAALEICNAVDDDCDGLIDDLDPSVDTSSLPDDPAYPACQIGEADNCRGEWRCSESAWMCMPGAPASETCDGLDNDCDGQIDQPFVDDMGQYLTGEHCGGVRSQLWSAAREFGHLVWR